MSTMTLIPTRATVLRDTARRFEDLHGRAPVALVDMDGTVFDWDTRFNEIALDRYPDFPVVHSTDRTDFDHLCGPDWEWSRVLEVMDDPRLYEGMQPIAGAVEGVDRLLEAGFKVPFASSPTWTNPGCVAGKVADVRQHWGPDQVKSLLLSMDKTILFGDVLIDDKPEITGANPSPMWEHLMYSQPYNAYRNAHAHRMNGWSDLDRALPAALGMG